MDKFDEKVIGYESTKEILRQILDILKRPEVYKRKGISIPRGLLMESDPGLGKSLLASILMEESERKPFVFRKTSQENSFLDELRTVFAMAKEETPSILLLEDLNLYVESNSPYAPEWACLQACIDDAKDTDLFVIATTNDTRYMPPSLLRPGRFDYVIYLQPPIGENAENIVSYYLRDKDLAEDVLISDIVKAMPKVSCATLETVMNLAALNSVYQGHEHIQKEDITEALLQVVYKLQKTDKETDSTELQKIAVHEAAHAVVGEVLHPGSIGIVTVRGSQGVIGGMANGCATYAQNEEEFLDEVTKTLAGRAGVSLIYGVMDIQASADIEQADKLMDIWLCHFAGGGFVGIESGDNRMSEQRLSYNEAIKSAKLEELYRRAYKILHNNKYFLLAVQHGLLEHETLLNSDLAKIREWRTSDLLLLKTAMSTIDISPRGNIRYYDFIDRVAGDEKLLTKLLGGKHIQRLPETYLVPLLGIKKLELLDTDEAYIVDTVENSLQSAGVSADRHKLENNLVQNYVAQEAQVNLDTEVNNYDLTMEMLFNLRSAEDSGLFQEEVVPEVQEVEPAEQIEENAKAAEQEAAEKLAEEGKAAEEEFLKANFEDSVPQLEELSEKGYARANAMLFWAYYFGYEDYPSDPQKALEYVKKGSDAADPICGLLYAAYSDISQAEKLEQFRKLRPQVRKMADAKDDLAILAFGACYFHDQQYEDAQKYLDQYEKAGGVLAYEMLGLMQQYIQKKGKTALTYYEKAVKNKFYYAYVLMGDLYSYGEQDMWVRLSLEISSCDCVVKRIDSYKKAVEHNQAEGAHKMAENTEGTVERAYWTKVAEKQGYKNGMKSWTSDIAEFNK